VGAFSSRESHRTEIIRKFRREWKASPFWQKPAAFLFAAYRWARYGAFVPPYPNFHVRTNGFMMRREVLRQVRKPYLFDKMEAFKFESGNNGLTRQLQAKGYEIVCLDDRELISDNRVTRAPGALPAT
jgi:hypothetical protein